ncbi:MULTISPECIES: tRNA (5-methylaminomethyl-2-thiouridine)(34)-methyltransferase MnmD [unclassified Thioalkalivibrio]|uniref:tRNA (5-methylaminomethyl-2-thiouridine)(34)-methyltransferase MnmD n=1 Tax=unclassified Thioalkalivibrio TaxID=2621013 RepID=UPI00037E65A1|nr:MULTISPECIES: tRNA (5-methylaminomethyl-2-thiouridine)(34)-methyltransferase MnmD [unclassified Thioalkalivibrio]PYG03961.1 tRNA 5-methylaminomethyl-2-thiouridine biosynthesis bifunctional protein [Thioalkalivibrio sp. ALE21]
MPEALAFARLEWRDGQPVSPEFGDGYFGSDAPLEEAHEVFLEANDLPRRFARPGARLAVAETGFGTGLNALLTLREWRSRAQPDGFLSLIGFESRPLHPDDLDRAHRMLGLDGPDAERLRSGYPPPVTGLHRIHFPQARAVLTLVFGDAAVTLPQLNAGVDAWYLDGFAPRRNPGLWNIGVFRQMARISRPGTTFGTYAAAGQVRRDLEAAGFTVRREPGHGRKRERLCGHFGDSKPASDPEDRPRPERVAVIGAGIAGLSAALALQDRGCNVHLFDPAGPGGGASGNPAAVLLPHLLPDDAGLNALALTGMRHTHALIKRAAEGLNGDESEVLLGDSVAFHGISGHARKRVQRLRARDPAESGYLFDPAATTPAGAPGPVLDYPGGRAVNMSALCRGLAGALPAVERYRVREVRPGPDEVLLEFDGDPATSTTFHAVVIATAGVPLCPEQARLDTVGGQMTRLRYPLASRDFRVRTGQGYWIRQDTDDHWIGATYRHDGLPDDPSLPPEPTIEDDHHNLRHLAWVPGMPSPEDARIMERWTGIRAVYRDRLPLVGASSVDARGRVMLTLGHGSRGLLYAPISGELAADRLVDLPEPVEKAVARRLSPRRLDKGPG